MLGFGAGFSPRQRTLRLLQRKITWPDQQRGPNNLGQSHRKPEADIQLELKPRAPKRNSLPLDENNNANAEPRPKDSQQNRQRNTERVSRFEENTKGGEMLSTKHCDRETSGKRALNETKMA